ncbi:MAG: ATP-binding cassette domain-containing protein [Microbacterium sp.]
MSSPGIVASGVRRSFGSVHAVRDVTLEARAGAVTGLVGPNGSGKTTLLLMLASLLAPDAGVLRIGGLDPVADPAGVRRIVGWMPDALGAWPSLTARETLVMTSRLYGIAPADAERGAARLLDELGLAELADTLARVFSRGRSSGSASPARSCTTRVCCCSTSPPRASTRRRVSNCGRSCVASPARAHGAAVEPHPLRTRRGRRRSRVRGRGHLGQLRSHRTGGDPRAARGAIRLADRDATAAVLPVAQTLGLDAALVPIDRRDLLVAFESDGAAAAALGALVRAGLPVAEFAAATGLLEHTFLDLEGGRS